MKGVMIGEIHTTLTVCFFSLNFILYVMTGRSYAKKAVANKDKGIATARMFYGKQSV